MPKWIILIGDESLTLKSIEQLAHHESTDRYYVYDTRYAVMYKDSHIFYDYDEDITDYTHEGEEVELPYKRPRFITMVFGAQERLKKIFKTEKFPSCIYVDDTALDKKIVPLQEFIDNIDDWEYY
jgi:hypothetical protein